MFSIVSILCFIGLHYALTAERMKEKHMLESNKLSPVMRSLYSMVYKNLDKKQDQQGG